MLGSRSNGQRSVLKAGGDIPCRPNPVATLLVIIVIIMKLKTLGSKDTDEQREFIVIIIIIIFTEMRARQDSVCDKQCGRLKLKRDGTLRGTAPRDKSQTMHVLTTYSAHRRVAPSVR